MKRKRILKRSALALLVVLFASVQFAYWTSTNDCDQKTGAPIHPMKAIRYCEYGAPDDVLKLEEVEKPVPNDNEILVRVRAVSLRFFDGGRLEGGFGRLILGLRKPRVTRLGTDLVESGKVVPAVTRTHPLSETAAAFKFLETGHVRGKIAITVE